MTDFKQKVFNKIKQIFAHDTLLIYPDFNECFDIHTDASNGKLGAVLSYNGKPIALYSHKLTPAQSRYTVRENNYSVYLKS